MGVKGGKPGGELMSNGILDGDDVEGSRVAISVLDNSNTPQVVTTGDHAQVTWIQVSRWSNNVFEFTVL